MNYNLNLNEEEEKIFLMNIGIRLEDIRKTISDMEEDVKNDTTNNLKNLQDEFKKSENVLLKFMYGEDLSSGFARYIYNKSY